MPLRDHFRPPLDDMRHWEGFHAQWPGEMVRAMRHKLPSRYFAEPRVHPGYGVEIDLATFHEQDQSAQSNGKPEHGSVATAVWAPARPSLSVTTDLPAPAEYAVRIFDTKRNCCLVAAVEIVSPANKDRPEHRRAFVAKCAALLQKRVSVVVLDVVTIRKYNLYDDLLELIGQQDATLAAGPPPLYAAACRATRKDGCWKPGPRL